jgi:hypothetical protein
MRRFALISLLAYLGLFMSPFIALAETNDVAQEWEQYKCDFNGYESMDITDDASLEAYYEWAENLDGNIAGKVEEGNGEATSAANCEISVNEETGEVSGLQYNEVTQAYNKGDCTAAGKVITEVTEVFGSEVSVGDDAIKTVYRGLCCIAFERDDAGNPESCKDVREVYFETYGECNDYPALECSKRQWIIGTSGAGIIKVYIKQLYIWAAGVVGFISVVTIVLNGIRISISGVSGDISAAKDRIIQAISGLVLLFLSGLILYTINPGFFS